MPTYKLKKDERYETWWRDYYEVTADSLEEAIQMVRNGDVDPYDVEALPNFEPSPIEMEILYEGEVVYHEEA